MINNCSHSATTNQQVHLPPSAQTATGSKVGHITRREHATGLSTWSNSLPRTANRARQHFRVAPRALCRTAEPFSVTEGAVSEQHSDLHTRTQQPRLAQVDSFPHRARTRTARVPTDGIPSRHLTTQKITINSHHSRLKVPPHPTYISR